MDSTAFLLRNQAMLGNCTLLLDTERGKKLCCYCSGLFKKGEQRREMHQGHIHTNSHFLSIFFLLKNKRNPWRDGKGNMHMERASILYFHRRAGKKGGGSSGARENDGGRLTCPDWQIVRYKKNFIDAVSLQCEGAAAGVAGAAKVA